MQELADSLVERRWIDAGPGGLAGKRIEFPGLQFTITDVLARVELQDGRSWTTIARPSQPWIEVTAAQSTWQVAGNYILEGIRHILYGADHLLFVLGLLLIVRNGWTLVKTITAFTVAHSITLAAATLGYAEVPAPPVEVAIALSILFLGPEIVRRWRGETSFTIRNPWVVAFAFGLLHGFGFASALTSAGLPDVGIAASAALLQRRGRTRATRFRRARARAGTRVPADTGCLARLGPARAWLRGRNDGRLLADPAHGRIRACAPVDGRARSVRRRLRAGGYNPQRIQYGPRGDQRCMR